MALCGCDNDSRHNKDDDCDGDNNNDDNDDISYYALWTWGGTVLNFT